MRLQAGEDDYLAREARARKEIDKQLAAAGWKVQSRNALNLSSVPGVAVREFTLEKPHGRVDYLLFLNGQPAGVAARAGVTHWSARRLAGWLRRSKKVKVSITRL